MEASEFDRYMLEISGRWAFRTPEARDDYAKELWAFAGDLEGEGFRRAVHEVVEKTPRFGDAGRKLTGGHPR